MFLPYIKKNYILYKTVFASFDYINALLKK